MIYVDDLIKRAGEFANGLRYGFFLRDIVTEYEAEICDMNTENQLFEQGVNRLGVSIMDYRPYRPLTLEIKAMKGQPTDRVTLRDEGDFHASFFVTATNSEFDISAADWKTKDLRKKYGNQIFGLTDENKNILTWEYIYPALLEKAHSLLYGKSTN